MEEGHGRKGLARSKKGSLPERKINYHRIERKRDKRLGEKFVCVEPSEENHVGKKETASHLDFEKKGGKKILMTSPVQAF